MTVPYLLDRLLGVVQYIVYFWLFLCRELLRLQPFSLIRLF